ACGLNGEGTAPTPGTEVRRFPSGIAGPWARTGAAVSRRTRRIMRPVRPSSLRDRAAFALQFHCGDAVGRHPHLLEPVGRRLLVGGFEDADGLALGQATEAAIALDHGILLGGLGHLVDLLAVPAARRQRMDAHELRHGVVSWESHLVWAIPSHPQIG